MDALPDALLVERAAALITAGESEAAARHRIRSALVLVFWSWPDADRQAAAAVVRARTLQPTTRLRVCAGCSRPIPVERGACAEYCTSRCQKTALHRRWAAKNKVRLAEYARDRRVAARAAGSIRACAGCGQPFKALDPKGSLPPQKFCSAACYRRRRGL